MISQKVVDGFGRNLVDKLGVSQGRIYLILVKIRIRIWIRELFQFVSDSSPLRDRAKNDTVLYSMIFQKCIGPDMFSWIRHYVADVCAPPSALLQGVPEYLQPMLVLITLPILMLFFLIFQICKEETITTNN